MKRFFIGLIFFSLTLFINVAPVGAASSSTVIRDFQADYYLNKDASGQSTLKVVETITAEFYSVDKKHGLVRSISTIYNHHFLNLNVVSVKDKYGNDSPYRITQSGNNTQIHMSDMTKYVSGLVTYVLTYEETNVTRYYSDTDSDEFYWDINGLGWSQPFDNLTLRLHLGPDIVSALTGKQACYYGLSGENNRCDITLNGDTFTVNQKSLKAGENVTVAVGFNKDTFTEPTATISDDNQTAPKNPFLITIPTISTIFVIFWTIYLIVIKNKKAKKVARKNAIVAQYLPPKDSDMLLSAVIMGCPSSWESAMYVDLAVRHNIRIIQSEGTYSFELLSLENLNSTEMRVIQSLFSNNPVVGNRYTIDPNQSDSNLSTSLNSLFDQISEWADGDGGYYIQNKKIQSAISGVSILSVVSLFISVFITVTGIIVIPLSFVLIINSIVTIIVCSIFFKLMKPLTQKGRDLVDYIEGLKLYITIAEADRIKFLQSPQGAERVPIDTNNKEEVIKLYEKVLSYAILLGVEKEWTKVLGEYYGQLNISPYWYIGDSPFDSSSFSDSLSTFSDSSTDSFSSDFGGSDGGGDSGGGGGDSGGGDE